MERNSPKICIVGAGVVGMTVARLVQDKFGKVDVTVIADKFNQDTTSAVAAGIFRPGTSFKGTNQAVTKKWVEDSWNYWTHILNTREGPEAGVMQLSAYIFSKKNYEVTRNHLIEDLVPIYRPVQDKELTMCGTDFKYGSYFSTLKIGCDKYLPWSERAFKRRGGKMVQDTIETLSSLKSYDLVFNCAGFGAKYLCNDHDLVPIRGQITKVRAPWLKMAYYGDYDTYIIPGQDGVATLGGVRQYDSYNMDVCKHDAAGIFERCCELVPGLKKAEVVGHKVGLRPHRAPVRVEGELVGGARVVHCYGHGGYGVTCAPGTAIHAVDIGLDIFKGNFRHKL